MYVQQYNISNCNVYYGGGVLNIQNSTIRLTQSIFQNNTAEFGAVLYVEDNTLTVMHNTFQNNSAGGVGGLLMVLFSTLIVIRSP